MPAPAGRRGTRGLTAVNAACLLLTLTCLAGTDPAATTPSAQPAPTPGAPAHARGRVYLLRGTGVVFSPGFGELGTELRQAGFDVEDLPCFGEWWVCPSLIADHQAGRSCGPLILVGHSAGGRHALSAAHKLEEAGIPVDLLVCLDAGLPSEVPGNVKRVLKVYMHHFLYSSCPLRPAPGASARIENVDLKDPHCPIDGGSQCCHLTIAASPAVRAFVLQRILDVAQTCHQGEQ
jgi:pimeloyl-ACP methyl ester carboxylesterase